MTEPTPASEEAVKVSTENYEEMDTTGNDGNPLEEKTEVKVKTPETGNTEANGNGNAQQTRHDDVVVQTLQKRIADLEKANEKLEMEKNMEKEMCHRLMAMMTTGSSKETEREKDERVQQNIDARRAWEEQPDTVDTWETDEEDEVFQEEKEVNEEPPRNRFGQGNYGGNNRGNHGNGNGNGNGPRQPRCILCNGSHYATQCEDHLTLDSRIAALERQGKCLRCTFAHRRNQRECDRKPECYFCKKAGRYVDARNHHSCLCPGQWVQY